MEFFLSLIIFILGICVGSFVNMLIYRTAVRYKLKTVRFKVNKEKRSVCDYCGRQLTWYENIPIVSWIVQNGQSRCCKKKLPLSYPLVEMGTGILFLIFNFSVRGGFHFVQQFSIFQFTLGLVLITLMWFSALFDVKYMILPDFSTIILTIAAFAGAVFDEKNIIPYLLCGIGMAGILWLLNLMTKGKGMGMGDVKLAMFIGLFLGWPRVVAAFYAAFIIGAIAGIWILIKKGWKKNRVIPFGPFLLLGTVIAWWWGDGIMYYLFNIR